MEGPTGLTSQDEANPACFFIGKGHPFNTGGSPSALRGDRNGSAYNNVYYQLLLKNFSILKNNVIKYASVNIMIM
jgi:hypothetical protein